MMLDLLTCASKTNDMSQLEILVCSGHFFNFLLQCMVNGDACEWNPMLPSQ